MINKILLILCMCFLLHNAAQAKGFFIINTGDEIFNIAPFPNEVTDEIEELKNLQVGYKCNHFGILWADFRIWDCMLVGVNPAEKDTYYELPKEIIDHLKSKPEYQENKMQRNFWNHYGMYDPRQYCGQSIPLNSYNISVQRLQDLTSHLQNVF